VTGDPVSGDPVSGDPVSAGRVVVVDGDRGMRLAVGRSLTRLGYDVHLADTAGAVLHLLAGEAAVAAVVTDLDLPAGMGGADLAWEIRHRHPRVAVLFLTAQPVPAVALTDPLVAALPRPAQMTDLHDHLQHLIATAGQQLRVLLGVNPRPAVPSDHRVNGGTDPATDRVENLLAAPTTAVG